MADETETRRDVLRAKYEKATGKKPFNGWSEEELKQRILYALGDDGNPLPDGERTAAGMVNIVVTVNHVYLPLDVDGSGRADWADAEETTRIEKRARLQVPADLAKFLSDRDQAEIL